MSKLSQALPRHLVFVLEAGEVVVQRAANIVELLETREKRVFNDYDRDHDVTDVELERLLKRAVIADFDSMTVWLPRIEESHDLNYYYLDTKLLPDYLGLIELLLSDAALSDKYVAKARMGHVAIMGRGGEPFGSLLDAEGAYMLVKQALSSHIADLSIESIQVNPKADETMTIALPDDFENLIRETPLTTFADYGVLVIEPNLDLAAQTAMTLENLGVRVRVAKTGENALEILMDEEPDIVIINLSLPDMHGYEVIAKIRKDPLTAETPIIAISDSAQEIDSTFALTVARVDEYLTNPVEVSALRHRVISSLGRR